jgi:hypothetical protein
MSSIVVLYCEKIWLLQMSYGLLLIQIGEPTYRYDKLLILLQS